MMKKLNLNRSAIIASLVGSSFDKIQKVNALWTKYETEIHQAVRRNGSRYALDRYKASYIFLRNLVLKLPANPIPFCKVDSQNIPKTLWPLRPLLKGNRNELRIALCIARTYELIRLPVDYSVESITTPSSYDERYGETKLMFNKMLEGFAIKYPWYIGSLQTRSAYEPRVFTSLSSGPNGPTVACAHIDAKAVVSDSKLHTSIRNLNNALGQSWITTWMEKQAESFTGQETYITGRLGFSAEPAGKTRIFAIADYWSQTSLKVIQDSLYNTLKSISTDATKDQDWGFKTLIEESNGLETYCFDLTSASDRIPAEMQRKRLDLMSGKNLGDAWLSVMTERTFLVKTTQQNVSWAVGQPLGLLSSFPSFALWHHDIVQLSYNYDRILTGKPIKFFRKYRILGDDLVIFNKEVAERYHYLISEVFNIEINTTKSVFGDKKNSQIEFAKRLALNGEEYSSLPYNILNKDNEKYLLDLSDLLYNRDFIQRDTGHYDLSSLLRSTEAEKFQFMLWARSDVSLPFKGDEDTFQITREDYNQKITELRSQNLMDKTALIDKYLCEALPLNEYYDKGSLPYSEEALGLGSFSDNLILHPLVWAINQTGLDLSIALSSIWDEQSPDITPVEYLPIVSSKSYFHKPLKRSNEYLSKLVLDAYKDLKSKSLETTLQ